MHLQERINAFVKLGDFLGQFSNEAIRLKNNVEHEKLFFDGFKNQIKLSEEHNGWFTQENILFALEGWANSLKQENILTL